MYIYYRFKNKISKVFYLTSVKFKGELKKKYKASLTSVVVVSISFFVSILFIIKYEKIFISGSVCFIYSVTGYLVSYHFKLLSIFLFVSQFTCLPFCLFAILFFNFLDFFTFYFNQFHYFFQNNMQPHS